VPQPTNAAVATVAAVAATGAVSVAVAAATPSTGLPADKIASKTISLLPSALKKWLASFIASKRKLKVEEKTGSPFKPTKTEIIAYSVSIVVLAFSFSYVKVEDITQMLTVLPTILATSIFVGFAKTFVSIAYSRHRGVWSEHKLWYFGLATMLVTTLAFRMPISSPTRCVPHSPKLTKRLSAILSIVLILISLAFAGFFYVLFLSGLIVIGSTGLAMCLIDAFFDTLPITPMNGKKIFEHSKPLWIAFFAATLALYVSWLLLI
jgi:Zn-dependent protease